MAIKINLNDVHLERDIISHLLSYPHLFSEANKLVSEESFTDALFKASYLAFKELSLEDKRITRADIFRVLKSKEKEKGISAELVLKLMPDRMINLEESCYQLKETEGKRRFHDLAFKIQTAILDNKEVSDLQTIITKEMDSLERSIESSEVFDISSVYDQVIDKLEANAGKIKFSGIDTGSRDLNYILGGFQEGMTVIAGRPGMGKTIAGLQHAKSAAKSGKRVLFLSLEMPKESLMFRLISSENHDYKYSDLKANRVKPDDILKIRNSNASILKSLPIFFYDSDNRDINYLSMILTSEAKRNKIDIVVIDYLQLIRDNQLKDQSDFAQVSSVSNKIQKLTRKLKIPIIALSQLSRGIESRSSRLPQLSDIRSSGNVEQDAIAVIGLYRDDYYKYTDARANNTAKGPDDNILNCVILKNRDGETCTIDRYVDVTTNRIADSYDELRAYQNLALSSGDEALKQLKNLFEEAKF
jgi:replicative DNA helicase